jgi:hypothetical protein
MNNNPTTAITDAIDRIAKNAIDKMLHMPVGTRSEKYRVDRKEALSILEKMRVELRAAMQSATPSTPELGELVEMLVQAAREREAATRLPDCIAGAQERLDGAKAKLTLGISSLQKEIDTKTAALEKCRDKFLHYEQLHRLKCTSEGDEKADRNRDMADMIDAALSSKGGVS